MLRGVWQALNCLSIKKMWAAVRENGDFITVVNYTIFAAIIDSFMSNSVCSICTWTSCRHILTKSSAIPQQLYKPCNARFVSDSWASCFAPMIAASSAAACKLSVTSKRAEINAPLQTLHHQLSSSSSEGWHVAVQALQWQLSSATPLIASYVSRLV